MTNETDAHPERGRVRMTAAFADEPFIEGDGHDEASPEREAEIASNELHTEDGEKCGRCGQVIAPDSDVRRTTRGDYVHEMCPRH